MLAESVTLSIVGGIVGTRWVSAWRPHLQRRPLPASVQPWSVGLGIGITAVVGVVFGVYPAMRAATLDPIEALRKD